MIRRKREYKCGQGGGEGPGWNFGEGGAGGCCPRCGGGDSGGVLVEEAESEMGEQYGGGGGKVRSTDRSCSM